MSRLCDPDINMIVLPGCKTPEPSIRQMIYHYYDSHGMGSEQSKLFTDQYLSEQDEICAAALDRIRQEAREEALREAAAACDKALAEMQNANPDRHDALPYIEDGCDACKEAVEALAQKDAE